MIVVDTSVLYALVDLDDTNHERAVAAWDATEDEPLVTHAYVVVETLALVRRRLGPDAARRVIDDLLPAVLVEMVDRELHDEALGTFREGAGGASLVDRVTITFARRLGITTALAFDRDLEVAGLRSAAG